MKFSVKIILSLLCLLFLLLPASLQAQGDNTGITLAASAGFDGYYKDIHWVPVNITVANSGSAIEGQLRIVTGSASANSDVAYVTPISLPTQSSKRVTLYVHLTTFSNRLDVDLLDHRGQIIRTIETDPLQQLDSEEILYAVVSNDTGDLTYLENVTGSRTGAAVAFIDLEALPESAPAWNALDVLILNNVDTGRFTPAQQDGLNSWLNTGGQLVVTGGAGWQQTVNGVADLLPVTITGNESVSDLPRLRALTSDAFNNDGPYLLTASNLASGEVLLQDEGVPLLARRTVGRGGVYFMALDPNAPPLQNWAGAEAVWTFVAERALPLPFFATGIKDSYSAQEAVSALPSLTLPSVWGVLCFLTIYIIVIGPINYVILKRLRRRELAWLTIPGLILFFSAATYIVGFSVRGNEAIVNQMSIAYGQLNGAEVRVHGLVGLYSPNRTNYDLVLAENHLLRPFQRTFGGVGSGGSLAAIEQNGTVTAQEVRLDISGIETFVVDTYSPLPAFNGQATLRLEEERFFLDVDVQNNSEVDILHAAILFGNRVEQVGPLAAGATFQDSFSLLGGSFTPGSPSGAPMFAPVGPGTTVLSRELEAIVGSTNPYDDARTRSWASLLRSLEYSYGTGVTPPPPASTVTLIAWTEASQFEMTVQGRSQENLATTLYFLEMPFDQARMSNTELTIDDNLQTWRLIDSSGLYNANPYDLDLSSGWVEFEYMPWPAFHSMTVERLEIELRQDSFSNAATPPNTRIWDWEEAEWVPLSGVAWGRNNVPLDGAYLGPQHSVRLRLSNDSFQTTYLNTVAPIYYGTLAE